MGFKNWWGALSYWKKGFYFSLALFLAINLSYLTWSILSLGEITCPTFSGSICGDTVIIGYMSISLIWFFWYFLLFGIPIIMIFWLVGSYKSKK
ncbi:hypothetical protein HYX08_00095 [Candidatus Woesearchaeota archaeon]|nr:hypothetical protein [Candidatus Woesearchaeota archaeon]